MPAIDRSADKVVTDHCALRFLERVLEVDIGTIAAHGESKRLALLCRDLGVTTSALKASILTPAVIVGLSTGANRVQVNGHWFALACGRVTTILPPEMLYRRDQEKQSGLLKRIKSPQVTKRQMRRLVDLECEV